jgi:hypothetical protein
LGKAKGRWEDSSTGKKKRRNHRCWTKEAFPVDESSLGGKTESRGEKIKQPVRPGALSLPYYSVRVLLRSVNAQCGRS